VGERPAGAREERAPEDVVALDDRDEIALRPLEGGAHGLGPAGRAGVADAELARERLDGRPPAAVADPRRMLALDVARRERRPPERREVVGIGRDEDVGAEA